MCAFESIERAVCWWNRETESSFKRASSALLYLFARSPARLYHRPWSISRSILSLFFLFFFFSFFPPFDRASRPFPHYHRMPLPTTPKRALLQTFSFSERMLLLWRSISRPISRRRLWWRSFSVDRKKKRPACEMDRLIRIAGKVRIFTRGGI